MVFVKFSNLKSAYQLSANELLEAHKNKKPIQDAERAFRCAILKLSWFLNYLCTRRLCSDPAEICTDLPAGFPNVTIAPKDGDFETRCKRFHSAVHKHMIALLGNDAGADDAFLYALSCMVYREDMDKVDDVSFFVQLTEDMEYVASML